MKKITLKVPAKINLTLDVSSGENGFHNIRSLVSSVSVYDTITLKKRKDKVITLKEKGIPSGANFEGNNAVKSARLFMESEGVDGVDIIIKKDIPVGGGMGGSSADIAGVMVGLKHLYQTDTDEVALANKLGSDSGYMCSGGYALLSGRGDIVQPIDCDKVFYYAFIPSELMISAKESYSWFDQLKEVPSPCTDQVVSALKNGDLEGVYKGAKNDLYIGTEKKYPDFRERLDALKNAGAKLVLMTGSGSVVYGVFEKEYDLMRALKTLRKSYKGRVIPAKTVKGIEIIEKK